MSICIFESFLFEGRLSTILGSILLTLKVHRVGSPEHDTEHGRAICRVNVKVFDVEDPDVRREIRRRFTADGWVGVLDDLQGSGKRMVFEPRALPGMASSDWYIMALVSHRLLPSSD
jgi:hypothetical protein